MAIRLASTDVGYTVGTLSLFPGALDSRYQLYEATNNAETRLGQSLTFNGKFLVVNSTDNFPDSGILRIGPPSGQTGPAEFIYYDAKTPTTFKNLVRGFAGSRQTPWPIGSFVGNAVFAEHHNAVKDAIIQMQRDLGLENSPDNLTLNNILQTQETRFLSPTPIFRAYPNYAIPGAYIRFQNFSSGPIIRYLWDFGDGVTSTEKSPVHVYNQEGIYTVSLSVVSTLGGQGSTTKTGYININNEARNPYMYVTVKVGDSAKTAGGSNLTNDYSTWDYTYATNFEFVDQTDGNIVQRYWVFGGPGKYTINNDPPIYNDAESVSITDPNVHTIKYQYALPGDYNPSLLTLLENQSYKRAYIENTIKVN